MSEVFIRISTPREHKELLKEVLKISKELEKLNKQIDEIYNKPHEEIDELICYRIF